MVGRYYDPATDQFLSVDPDLAETGQPYAFTGDDPLNATDPLGLCVKGFGWLCSGVHKVGKVVKKAYHVTLGVYRLGIDAPQDMFYAEYWASYKAITGLNSLAKHCGSLRTECSVATHFAAAPLVPFEAQGLGGDVAGNYLKGETIWQEGYKNQPLLGNEKIPGTNVNVGQGLSNALHLPSQRFPGFDFNHHVDFAY